MLLLKSVERYNIPYTECSTGKNKIKMSRGEKPTNTSLKC